MLKLRRAAVDFTVDETSQWCFVAREVLMTKFRGLVLAGLIGLLVVGASPAQAVTVGLPATAAVSASAQVQPFPEQTAPPGPMLDPAGTAAADAATTRNKLVAGGIALVLLLLVLWGRSVRKKKPEKS
jgi:hypothetical protein